jgi:hypothetical protein
MKKIILDNEGNPIGQGRTEMSAKRDASRNLFCSVDEIENWLSLDGWKDASLHFASEHEIGLLN